MQRSSALPAGSPFGSEYLESIGFSHVRSDARARIIRFSTLLHCLHYKLKLVGDLIKLLGVDAVGPFDGAVELGRVRR
jgi:hypothetical protein